MQKTITVRALVPMMLVAAATLAGCGEQEVPKASVEQAAMKTLSATVGKESPPITCPSGLKAKVGATLTCAMDIDGKTHDVKVAVTSLEGSSANFSVEVADKPRS
jgi:hypothetical protein